MAIELIHAKLERGKDMAGDTAYIMDFIFGSQFTDSKGNNIGKTKTIHMAFKDGMPPEDFVSGLMALADHIQKTIVNSDEFEKNPELMLVDNKSR